MLIRADARNIPLRDGCVQTVITSPPYWGLRDYGTPGQIGLEATPELYVAAIVDVFAEVWRVLRVDGTVWLNLGDSYATGGGMVGECQGGGKQGESWRLRGIMTPPNRMPIEGLKPKDLVGIPWRVAFALQQPQYLGTIKNREDRIWLAAMLDAEGCLFIHKRKAGQHNGQGYFRHTNSFGPGVEITNTSLAIVERVAAIVGKGSICSQGPDQTNGRRRQTIYRWNLRTTESRDFVQELYPHLVGKQQQARLLFGCPSSGERAEAAHAGLMALHRSGESAVDFPAPPSLFRPGWYLRSDIIWSKCNPMPEAVKDRPSKSHEYLFLLTKRERYHYDAAAIQEPYAESTLREARYGYRGTATKEYGAAGAQDPSETKKRIVETIRRRRGMVGSVAGKNEQTGDRRKEGFNDRWNNRERLDRESHHGRLAAGGRNKRTVWTIPTRPFAGAHFATFPEALVEPCILAGCPVDGLVCDPFVGSGTVGAVAQRLGRRWVGVDLNSDYHVIAAARTAQSGLTFAESEVPA
jgi:DNA modification methylase